MKIVLLIICSLILAGLVYFFYLGYKSQTGSAPGLVNKKLSPCSSKPNCICTEYTDDRSHFSNAIKYTSENKQTVFDTIHNTIKETGGIIKNTQNNYIAATYTSNIFRYVDDFEIRIDYENKLIHIRSASRVGHSDLGANLKRVELFKELIASTLK